MRLHTRALVATFGIMVGSSTQVWAQDGLPNLQAFQMLDPGERITIDGILGESVWARASLATGFRQREPFEGQPATERTEVRVAYDQSTLYIGITLYDGEPDAIIARILQRDKIMSAGGFGGVSFSGDDGVALLFDTFHDHRNGFIFATNPNGAEFDALITDEGRETNADWRGVWRVAARQTTEGWMAEFAIPFRTLRFPNQDTGEPWGFNVYRIVRRKNEEVLWSSWSRQNEGFHRVRRAGHLEGLTNLPRPGLNMEVKPYLLAGATQQRDAMARTDTDLDFDAGLDVKWEVSPGLVLDLTANTDFAQVEADDEQVNLTRFSLFFPEKRDFFLENSGIFDFGSRGFFGPPPFIPFFSRRIGITNEGAVPVIAGSRLTGRVGAQTIGLLNVVTDEAFTDPRTNFAVARVKRDVGGANYIGAMVTDRRSNSASNSTVGFDWAFWPTSRLIWDGYISTTHTEGAGGEGTAFSTSLDYTSNFFGFNVSHLGISEDARADMGFITRTDLHQSQGFFRITPRPQTLGLRKIDLRLSTGMATRFDGRLQDWSIGETISPEWNSGEQVSVEAEFGFVRIDAGDEFDISRGRNILVNAGDYDTWRTSISGSTSGNRVVVLNGRAQLQGIYDGEIFTTGGGLTVQPTANISTSLSVSHNHVDIPTGSFDANLASFRLTYAFSTKLVANALVQYNSQGNIWDANVRVNFIHTPGSDLYVVFNEQRVKPGQTWQLGSRSSVVKLTYLARI